MHPDYTGKVVAEVDKLVKSDFVKEVQYPVWLANIVLVMKKNRKLNVFIDFKDLKKAYPNNDFPFLTWSCL